LDRLEKGIEGDMSALARGVRLLNRFRKNFTQYTLLRVIHLLVPENRRAEFLQSLSLLYPDLTTGTQNMVAKLCGITVEEAKQKLETNNNDVFKTVSTIVEEKERIAKKEIKKKTRRIKIGTGIQRIKKRRNSCSWWC